MPDKDKIKKEGIRLLDEFSEALKNVPETKETHYVVDMKNVWRQDKKPKKTKDFRKKMRAIAPKMEEGYVVAEKGV